MFFCYHIRMNNLICPVCGQRFGNRKLLNLHARYCRESKDHLLKEEAAIPIDTVGPEQEPDENGGSELILKIPGPWGRFQSLPAIFLILANLLPLYGVLFWGWKVFTVMFLFWLESAIIGGYNILKMLTVIGYNVFFKKNLLFLGSLFLVVFFTVHYGGFMFGHLVFICALLGPKIPEMANSTGPADMIQSALLVQQLDIIKIAAYTLLASHGMSFIYNFLLKRKYQTTVFPALMFAPYGRIIIMHIAIIAGAFAVLALGAQPALLAILVGLKLVIDLICHTASHKLKKQKKKPKPTAKADMSQDEARHDIPPRFRRRWEKIARLLKKSETKF